MKIKLSDIIPMEHFNFRAPNENLDSLCESIKKHGILSPLNLIQKNNTYFLWSGFRRYYAAKKLPISEIPYQIETEAASDSELIIRHIEENRSHAPFNMIEKANLVHLCDTFFKLDPLHLKLYNSILEKQFFEQLRQCPSSIIHYYLEKKISDDTLRRLIVRFSDNHGVLVKAMVQLQMTHQTQKLFLELIERIIKLTENNSIEDLLNTCTSNWQHTLTAQDKPLVLEKLLESLKEKAYPIYSQLTKTNQMAIDSLKLPSHVHIQPFPYFSKNGFELHCKIYSKNELKIIIDKLHDAYTNDSLDALFKTPEI